MQKLIDELNLYPAKDIIPTELAEKILPVFQVNSENIEVQIKPKYLLWQDVSPNEYSKILTVPDEHTYVIKSMFMKYKCSADASTRHPHLIIKDKAGNTLLNIEFDSRTASNNYSYEGLMGYGSFSANAYENDIPARFFPLPFDMPLKEGYTVQWYAFSGGNANDDIEISIMVDDIKD